MLFQDIFGIFAVFETFYLLMPHFLVKRLCCSEPVGLWNAGWETLVYR